MRHRSIVLLVGGLLGLAFISPVFAAGKSSSSPAQSPPPPSSSTTSSTPPTPPTYAEPPDSSNCTPEATHAPAPAEGASESYPAGDGGSVEVGRTSATDLEVAQVSPSPGWTEEVTTPSGPRVKVKFTEDANPDSIVRFAAALNDSGTEIHIRVTSCQ